ncbi:MAG TPA: hypothetical protein VG248_10705, partial [Caulobacteraceae bacterium]|nr:hypothetical protein [Caulobacteraceae bacterium]
MVETLDAGAMIAAAALLLSPALVCAQPRPSASTAPDIELTAPLQPLDAFQAAHPAAAALAQAPV